MMKKRKGVIDLGTNTFNLLIIEEGLPVQSPHKLGYRILYNDKIAVKLGKGGIHEEYITPDAFDRGIHALSLHQETLNRYQVQEVHAIATSAIRSAQNGKDFVDAVYDRLGLEIKVIEGDREAELIFQGVSQAVPLSEEKVLILDIGGGSNEFIIGNKDGIFWKRSFPLGMARLLELFQPSDPITQEESHCLCQYFEKELTPLFEALKVYPVTTLIGSSGSFDTLAEMLVVNKYPEIDLEGLLYFSVSLEDFYQLHHLYLKSTLGERKMMKGMDLSRAEMMVLASLFIEFVLKRSGIQNIVQCDFALKEGVISQILNHLP